MSGDYTLPGWPEDCSPAAEMAWLKQRIIDLEAEVADLKAKLAPAPD